jgi:hypothetical protein
MYVKHVQRLSGDLSAEHRAAFPTPVRGLPLVKTVVMFGDEIFQQPTYVARRPSGFAAHVMALRTFEHSHNRP